MAKPSDVAGYGALASLLTVLGGCGMSIDGSSADMPEATKELVRQFKAVDSAGQGVVTLEQTEKYYAARFTELDTNRDGFLDGVEIAPMLPAMQARDGPELVRFLDTDGDGKISTKEFQVFVNVLFQRSRSSNNTLTLKEIVNPTEMPGMASSGPPAVKKE